MQKCNPWPDRIGRLLEAMGRNTGCPLPASELARELARLNNPSCVGLTVTRWICGATIPSYRYKLALYGLEVKYGIAKGLSPSQLIAPRTYPNEY